MTNAITEHKVVEGRRKVICVLQTKDQNWGQGSKEAKGFAEYDVEKSDLDRFVSWLLIR